MFGDETTEKAKVVIEGGYMAHMTFDEINQWKKFMFESKPHLDAANLERQIDMYETAFANRGLSAEELKALLAMQDKFGKMQHTLFLIAEKWANENLSN